MTTISSLDFLNNVINPAREAAGESKIENRHFLRKLMDEIDDLPSVKIFRMEFPQGGSREINYYDLNTDQMMLVGMRESKAVRKKVLAYIRDLEEQANVAPMTPDEMVELCSYIQFKAPSTGASFLLEYRLLDCSGNGYALFVEITARPYHFGAYTDCISND